MAITSLSRTERAVVGYFLHGAPIIKVGRRIGERGELLGKGEEFLVGPLITDFVPPFAPFFVLFSLAYAINFIITLILFMKTKGMDKKRKEAVKWNI